MISFAHVRAVLLSLLAAAAPYSLAAQEIRGFVLDQSTGTPLVNVLVRVDPLGSVTLTDDQGWFILRGSPRGRYAVSFQTMGYESVQVTAEVPAGEPCEIRMRPRPIEIPGIEVWGEGVPTRMDLRLARLPGASRVVNAETVRLYDSVHARDPWRLLWRELRVGWDMDMDLIRVRFGMSTRVRPEVYIDDHRTWLINLVLMPNTLLCRVEMYQPLPHMGNAGSGGRRGAASAAATAFAAAAGTGSTGGAAAGSGAGTAVGPAGGAGSGGGDGGATVGQVPFQLRAYTCLFMAEVAEGKRTMRRTINWGDLIAGPGGR